MNATQIDTTYKAALRFVSMSRLKPAFDRVKMMIDDLQNGEFSDLFLVERKNHFCSVCSQRRGRSQRKSV